MRLLAFSSSLLASLSCVGQGSTYPGSAITFIPDSVLAGVVLRDTTSALSVLGRIPGESLLDDHQGMPRASFFNRDNTEVLTVHIHYGGYTKEYCELRLSPPDHELPRAALPVEGSSSGRGVALAISEAGIVRKFGTGAVRSVGNNGNVVLAYAIKDHASSPFLQRFNYPSYYARFTFERGRLIDYRFGFEYP